MTILRALEVMCDACAWWERVDTRQFETDWPTLKKEGWSRQQGMHFCPTCTKEVIPVWRKINGE
jgi:hypothetical protein